MTWSPLRAPATKNKPASLTVGCCAAGPRKHAGLSLVLRTAQMPGLDFLQPRKPVDVLLGHGEHANMLRIQAGTEFLPYTNSKAKASGTIFLRGIPLPKGLVAGEREHVPVQYDYSTDWLELTLPPWARVAATRDDMPAAPAVRSTFALAAGVPDPAAALRGRRG